MGREEKERLFLAIGDAFLSEDSQEPLNLSNGALWNDLAATYASLKAGLKVNLKFCLDVGDLKKWGLAGLVKLSRLRHS
jgi:hypothetical protein